MAEPIPEIMDICGMLRIEERTLPQYRMRIGRFLEAVILKTEQKYVMKWTKVAMLKCN
jgi:hypothetical protein